jgi:hypothetical protein
LPGVIEEILVAGDDRLGTSFPGQREEIVVLGISQGRLDLGGIVERNRDHLDPLHGSLLARRLARFVLSENEKTGEKRPILDLAEQLVSLTWADRRLAGDLRD